MIRRAFLGTLAAMFGMARVGKAKPPLFRRVFTLNGLGVWRETLWSDMMTGDVVTIVEGESLVVSVGIVQRFDANCVWLEHDDPVNMPRHLIPAWTPESEREYLR